MYRINIWNMLIIFGAQVSFKSGETYRLYAAIPVDWQRPSGWVLIIIFIIKIVFYSCTSRFKEACFIQIFSRFWNSIKRPIERGSRAGATHGFSTCNLYSTRCSTRRLFASTATQKNTYARRHPGHERLNGFVNSNVYFVFLSPVRSDMFQEAIAASVVCMSGKS